MLFTLILFMEIEFQVVGRYDKYFTPTKKVNPHYCYQFYVFKQAECNSVRHFIEDVNTTMKLQAQGLR